MKKHGWNVKEHHHLDTAWEATFEYGQGGRVIGVNSEESPNDLTINEKSL